MKCAVFFTVCLVATPTLLSQEVGDEVVVIAEQRAELRDESGVVGTVGRGHRLVIWEIKGDDFFVSWLTTCGWVDKADVLTLDKALPYFTEEIGRSADAQDYFGRANVHYAKGRYDEAIADCDNALRIDPKFSPAYRNRGAAWTGKGEFDKAAADLDEAVRLDPQDALAYFRRGLVRYVKGEYDEAIADSNVLMGMHPDLPWAYLNRGNARAAKGQLGKAVADFSEAIRLDPDDAGLYNNRGKAWTAKGEYGKAQTDFEKALRLDPTSPQRYNALAWIFATCPDASFRDGKKAVEHATKACELTNWQDFGWLDTLAAAYAESGEFARALKWQRKAIELAPDEWTVDLRSRLDLYDSGKPYREKRGNE